MSTYCSKGSARAASLRTVCVFSWSHESRNAARRRSQGAHQPAQTLARCTSAHTRRARNRTPQRAPPLPCRSSRCALAGASRSVQTTCCRMLGSPLDRVGLCASAYNPDSSGCPHFLGRPLGRQWRQPPRRPCRNERSRTSSAHLPSTHIRLEALLEEPRLRHAQLIQRHPK